MRLHWTEWAALAASAGSAVAALGLAHLHAQRRAAEQRQHAAERRLAALADTVRTLQAQLAELKRQASPSQPEAEPIAAAPEGAQSTRLDPARPEVLVAIAAAATAFLGKNARIRSAKLMPAPQDTVSPWSQQGRVIVQTSHNLRSHD